MKTFARILVAFLLATAVFDAAAQVIGRVLVAAGQVSVVRQGQPRAAVVGTGLEVGDTVVTGAASNTQLRFSDNSLVALRESSRFLVERYTFEDARGPNALTFSLLKGGLRTITGLIGKSRRPQDYQVKTPIASVGVRGTQYALLYCDNDCGSADGTAAPNGAYGGVFDGRVGVSNNAGEVVFGRDEYFFVADINTIPQPLLGPPTFLADRLSGLAKNAAKSATEPAARASEGAAVSAAAAAAEATAVPVVAYSTADTRGPGGGPALIAPAANTFFAFAHSLVETNGGQASYGGAISVPPGVVTNLFTTSGSGTSQALAAFSLEPVVARSGTVGPAAIDMQGFDPASGVHWGRWRDGTIVVGAPDQFLAPGAQTPPTGVHYMFGATPTTEAVLAAKTGTLTYSDAGGTTPTDGNGQVATSFTFGAMNVNFTARTANLSSLNIAFPTSTWSYSNVAFSVTPGGFNHVSAFVHGIGSCVGPGCGGSQGPNNATIDTTGVFLGTSANFLGLAFQGFSGANVTNNRIAWAATRIYHCANCP